MSDAATRLANVRAQIARSANAARRNPADVTLIAVTKRRSIEEIEPLIAAGVTDFGENRVQDAMAKWASVREVNPALKLHMIGRLQSNKANEAVRLFDAIHSLDRLSLLQALIAASERASKWPEVYIQVNIGGEEQKGGVAVSSLAEFLDEVRATPLRLAGLMAMPPIDQAAGPYFALLADLAWRYDVRGLSMGMSSDYPAAVMLGATAVRVGSALFED